MKPYPTKYWHYTDDHKIQCDVCPRGCKLKEGQRGLCYVRGREKNQIVLYTYGRSSGFCIDPIEKKPLNHFFPGSSVLSFGTAGCNLICQFCQNWSISKSKEMDTLSDRASPEVLAKVAKKLQCKSVAFTYNDPVIFMEYAIDVAKECRKLGIHTVAVTAGYINPEPREEFYRYMDAANVDLKGFTESFYKKFCGGYLQPVLDTLVYLKKFTNVWIEITTLLIPDENDSKQEIQKECEWILKNLGSDVPLHFTAFHPDFKMLNKSSTPHTTLLRARKVAQEVGLQFVYVGNVYDENAESTYCPNCKRKIIGRNWYTLSDYYITSEGKCQFCGYVIPGRFDKTKGNWGAKRVPIHIGNFTNY
ncbi:MAG: AmmeMemoRadiSam system radical SAM enzyme [Leptonema sp. (in: bacteria)]